MAAEMNADDDITHIVSTLLTPDDVNRYYDTDPDENTLCKVLLYLGINNKKIFMRD